jgi:hypothetical protein
MITMANITSSQDRLKEAALNKHVSLSKMPVYLKMKEI